MSIAVGFRLCSPLEYRDGWCFCALRALIVDTLLAVGDAGSGIISLLFLGIVEERGSPSRAVQFRPRRGKGKYPQSIFPLQLYRPVGLTGPRESSASPSV